MRRRWGVKRKRGLRFFLFLLFVAALFLLIEVSLSALVQDAARLEAHEKVLATVTRCVRDTIASHESLGEFEELMHVERDTEGRVTLMVPDTLLLNQVASDVSLAVAETFDTVLRSDISLPLGAATGSQLFADLGPDIRIRLRVRGSPNVTIRDDFSAAGVNQVRYRIWLTVCCEVRVLVPFSRQTEEIETTVLLAEGVIVGIPPETYISLDTTR